MNSTSYDWWALFWALLSKELKAKYKSTILGYLWSVLLPLSQSLIFFVVFSMFLRFPIEDYFLFLTIGFVGWQFFSNGLLQGANTLLSNSNLIRKTSVPRIIYVLAAMGAETVHFLVSLPILLTLMLCCGRAPSWKMVYMLPSCIVAVVALTVGCGLIMAIFNAYFRDLDRILQICLQICFYVTPVFYSLEQIPEHYRSLMMLNPLFFPLQLLRGCFYAPTVPTWYIPICLAEGALMLLLGSLFFQRFSRKLAEVL